MTDMSYLSLTADEVAFLDSGARSKEDATGDHELAWRDESGLSSSEWWTGYLHSLIGSWRSLVEGVEVGYELSSSDYDSALFDRSGLEEIRCNAPDALRQKLDQHLSSLDERFKRATWETSEPISLHQPREYWWYYRLPTIYPEVWLSHISARRFDELKRRGII